MFKKILVAIDVENESSWKQVFPPAIDLAKNNGGSLHVLSVVEMDANNSWWQMADSKTIVDKQLAMTTTHLRELCDANLPTEIDVEQSVKIGNVHREIIDAVKEVEPDLIIMAAHRPSLKEYLLGVNTARVARHASCSVLIVRE